MGVNFQKLWVVQIFEEKNDVNEEQKKVKRDIFIPNIHVFTAIIAGPD